MPGPETPGDAHDPSQARFVQIPAVPGQPVQGETDEQGHHPADAMSYRLRQEAIQGADMMAAAADSVARAASQRRAEAGLDQPARPDMITAADVPVAQPPEDARPEGGQQ